MKFLFVWLILISIIAIIGFVPVWFPALKRAFWQIAPVNAPEAPTVELVASILDGHPEEWESDGYRLTHKVGISIWVANSDYGLRLNVSGGDAMNTQKSNVEMGDKTRLILWSAVQRHQEWQANRASVAFAERVTKAFSEKK